MIEAHRLRLASPLIAGTGQAREFSFDSNQQPLPTDAGMTDGGMF